jgi:SAM-dependent methyltransferase
MSERMDVVCEICGVDQSHLLYHARDRLLGHPGIFPIVRCDRCGLIYQNPRPRDLTPYYAGGYAPYEEAQNPPIPLQDRHGNIRFNGLAGMQHGLLTQAVGHTPGRILDVGCANGEFLAALQQIGWDVFGVELNEAAAQIAEHRLGSASQPRITIGNLESASFPDQSFDVVTLWHVIEHLAHPSATLAEVRRILAPGGACIIQTPNWQSAEAKLFRSYWAGLDAPRHCWIFNQTTLTTLAQRIGLRLSRRLTCTSYPLFALSIRFLLTECCGTQVAEQCFRFLHRPLVSKIGMRLLTPIDSLRFGSQLNAVFIRI